LLNATIPRDKGLPRSCGGYFKMTLLPSRTVWIAQGSGWS
jgi:hypothetical protein